MTRWVTAILAIALTLGAVAWSLGIYQILALSLYEEQFAAAMLAACMALTFLHLPARRDAKRTRVPWYDWAAAAAGFAAAGYIAVQYASIVDLILLGHIHLLECVREHESVHADHHRRRQLLR